MGASRVGVSGINIHWGYAKVVDAQSWRLMCRIVQEVVEELTVQRAKNDLAKQSPLEAIRVPAKSNLTMLWSSWYDAWPQLGT